MRLSQIEFSLSQSFAIMAEVKMAEFKMVADHQINQIELVGVRVRVEWECFWVNLREDNKVSESKMAVSESKMAEFKMAAIIKLSQNEWVKFLYVQMVGTSVSEVFFVQMVGTNLGKCEFERKY